MCKIETPSLPRMEVLSIQGAHGRHGLSLLRGPSRIMGWVAETADVYFLMDLEDGSSRSRCQWRRFLVRPVFLVHRGQASRHVLVWPLLCACLGRDLRCPLLFL